MLRFSLLLAVGLVACSDSGSEVTPTTDAAVDSSVADTAAPKDTGTASDTASKPDTATAPDTNKPDTAAPEEDTSTPAEDTATPAEDVKPDGSTQCVLASDCRKYSSYCSTDPCVCIPLTTSAPAPKCSGSMVTCFIDPCASKTVDCVAGRCVIK